MMNKMEDMRGGAQEVPPGYSEALERYNKLTIEEQMKVMGYKERIKNTFIGAKKDIANEKAAEIFKAGEGKLPSAEDLSVSTVEEKGYFVIAVEKFFADNKESARSAQDMERYADKSQFRDPKDHREQIST